MKSRGFIEACKTIGKDTDLIQGGGGNISVKLDSREMMVKSSGTELKKVSKTQGHVLVDFKKIAEFIGEYPKKNGWKEEPYARALNESVLGKSKKMPSMETGFHSVLGKTVIHTHPVAVNSICCEKNAKKNWKKMLGKKFDWIPYKSPGMELSAALYDLVKKSKKPKKPHIILLENHGLIVSSDSLKECIAQTTRINALAKNFLKKKMPKVFLPSNIRVKSRGKEIELSGFSGFLTENPVLAQRFVFPDAVVYTERKVTVNRQGMVRINEKNPKKRKKILEVLAASLCILMNISKYGEPKFLSEKKVLELKKMTLEKLRKEAG